MRWFVIFVLSLFIGAGNIHAAGEFHTRHVVNYIYDSTGNLQIEQNISLTNKQTNIYATRYQLTSTGEFPQDISGHDSKGPLKITNTGRIVTIEFNDQVVGRDNTLNFTLKYSGSPVVHNGQVYEVLLPRLGNLEQIDDYELNLIVPEEFGKLAFISPFPSSSDGTRYTFSKQQIAKAGVVAAFGNFQTFGFDLRYHLANNEPQPVYTEIALPPDTNYQRVSYTSIEPRPVNVRLDEDGNWLARYDLKRGESVTVIAQGQAHILAEPSRLLTDNFQDLTAYLKPTEYWPVDDPEIAQLARKLATPKAIHDYVAQTLEYDYQKIEKGGKRLGAKQALANPASSVCTEFADLFITLARAAGIPAREVNGYAHTSDPSLRPLSLVSDVLHAWPQYWDFQKQTWISIDPTWENTTGGIDYFNKLDFNHFSFVIHGTSDTFPLSAGQYKQEPNSRDVNVFFSDYKEFSSAAPVFKWQPPWQIFPILESSFPIVIKNDSGQAVHGLRVQAEAQGVTMSGQTEFQVSTLPPFSQSEVPIYIAPHPESFLTQKTLILETGNQVLTYNIPVSLYLAWFTSVGITCSSIIIVVAYIAVRAGSLHLQRRHRSDSLRGQSQELKK